MKLLCLGDSLTYGYDVACDYRWTTKLAKERSISVCNEGLCGDTTRGMLYRVRRMELASFDAFFFMGGSNDILMDISPSQIRQNLKAVAILFQKQKKTVYIGIPILTKPESAAFGWQGRNDVARHNEALRSHRQWLLQLAEQYHFAVVDFYGAMLQAEQDGQTNLYDDGVHPNEEGYAVMARAAVQTLKTSESCIAGFDDEI